MTVRALQELLVIHPDCDAVVDRGRKHRAEVVATVTHPQWKKPERAHLCRRHLEPFKVKAEAAGCTVVVDARVPA